MGKVELGFALLVGLLAVVYIVNAQVIEDKDGRCPPVNATYVSNSTNNRSNECFLDSACPFDHKCCEQKDGINRCTEPIHTPSTMKPTTEIVKNGECPLPRYHHGHGCSKVNFTCSRDSDCNGAMKCCQGYINEGCSVCKNPVLSETTTVSPKPHRYQPGECPENFEQFYRFDTAGITCNNHCNGTEDCGEGELCCVEERYYDDDSEIIVNRKRRDIDGSHCPVCKKANLDCQYDYDSGQVYKNGEMYKPYYDDCTVCQCFQGQTNCYYVCKDSFDAYEWIAAGVTAGTALLISMIFTLSVCCCLKCCCKDKKQNIVMSAPPMMVQQPGNLYYMAPRQEEKLTLTKNDHSIA